MLQIKNLTPFKASVVLLPNANGIDTLFTVVKGTFALAQRLTVSDEQVPVVLGDQYYDDPATSSIRLPSDVCLGKPGTDIVLLGSAWAPGGTPTWQMDVSVTVGGLMKHARVFGDRVWASSAAGTSAAWVAPFERMPLTWERAFGGSDVTNKGPTAEARNPVGAGFRVSDGAKALAGMALPNVEDPRAPISSWRDSPDPVGFAPIAPHWEPRKSFAGTYDDAWMEHRAPYLPADFDPQFFQCAPPGLTATGHLQGDELVDLRGVTPEGILQSQLPALRVIATYCIGASRTPVPAVLDTVILEPDALRMVLVWRAALACDKKALQVRQVEAAAYPS